MKLAVVLLWMSAIVLPTAKAKATYGLSEWTFSTSLPFNELLEISPSQHEHHCVYNPALGSDAELNVENVGELLGGLNTGKADDPANAPEEPNISPIYDPMIDSECFNDYYTPSFSQTDMRFMYDDYVNLFEWGFENVMGSPLQSVSSSSITPTEPVPSYGIVAGDMFLGEITRAFEASAIVRFDNLDPYPWQWSRQQIFDFGNGVSDSVALGQLGNNGDMALEVYHGSRWKARVVAPGVIIPGEEATWRCGIEADGTMWIEKNGVRVAEGAGVVPNNVWRYSKLIGDSNKDDSIPLVGEVLAFRMGPGTGEAAIQDIHGAFKVTATVQFNSIADRKNQRIFDFGNGPQSDNVWFGQVGSSSDMELVFYIRTAQAARLVASNVIVAGETATWECGVDMEGLTWIEKNGVRVVEQNVGDVLPEKVERLSKHIGRSNTPGDSALNGEVVSFHIGPFGVDRDIQSIPNNRFPGMFSSRSQCFHDNSVDPEMPDFQDYINSNIDGFGRWQGPSRYLKTSGADASVLTCPSERLHPNQNYDKTASRILYALQKRGAIPGNYSMKEKYKLSYADLLHNGCIAANIYLRHEDRNAYLNKNPMIFGRHDACHRNACNTAYPLCGPTQLLPGLAFTVDEFNDWFKSRGMDECLWMSLMWSHATLDNMAITCPLKKLTCTTTQNDVDTFARHIDRLYFEAGDNLDYFDFFLEPGSHETERPIVDPEEPSCSWSIDGERKPWPLTAADCTLGLDSVERAGATALATAITNFHQPNYPTSDIFQCALNILGGSGAQENRICDEILPTECRAPADHKFGAFFDSPFVKGDGPCGGGEMLFEFSALSTDGNTDELLFELNSADGKLLFSSKSLGFQFVNDEVSTFEVCLEDDGTKEFEFVFIDTGGDGMGAGSNFTLRYNGQVVRSGIGIINGAVSESIHFNSIGYLMPPPSAKSALGDKSDW